MVAKLEAGKNYVFKSEQDKKEFLSRENGSLNLELFAKHYGTEGFKIEYVVDGDGINKNALTDILILESEAHLFKEKVDQDKQQDTQWLQMESLLKFARQYCYTWGGDGRFYYFGDNAKCPELIISFHNMQLMHNKFRSTILKKTYLVWDKKNKEVRCDFHWVSFN